MNWIFGAMLVAGVPVFADYLQCYSEFRTSDNTQRYLVKNLPQVTIDACVQHCSSRYYKFIALNNAEFCYCMNTYEGDERPEAECDLPCPDNPQQFCGGRNRSLSAIYETGVKVPGAPRHLSISNITSTTMRIIWLPPEYKKEITSYEITARVVHTYAASPPTSLSWKVYNTTLQYSFYEMHPGTTYNISVTPASVYGLGFPASVIAATDIDIPEPSPPIPKVTRLNSHQVEIDLTGIRNDNGPITSVQVVVINVTEHQYFVVEYLKGYKEAISDRLPYYITAELTYDDVKPKRFVIGDGNHYGGYWNPQLPADVDVDVALGVISRNGSTVKSRYSTPAGGRNGVIILMSGGPPPRSNLNAGLAIAIAVLGILLLLSIVAFVYLKRRLAQQQRRTADCQELTLQGPILEMENNGYIPEEEEERVNHYDNLRDKVWSIPKTFLDINHEKVLGMGKFGRVVAGSVQRDSTTVPVAIQVIPDYNLQKKDAKAMIQQLNTLVVVGSHQNIISLIGFYENPTTLYIVMESYESVFKDWLLQGRVYSDDGTKVTPLLQADLMNYFIQIANGMNYLCKQRIVHGQLCCRNVLLDLNSANCKVTGIGLSDFSRQGVQLDYSRWQAHELFRQRQPSFASDVWSFGVLLWEGCALGGTPFAQWSNQNVANEIRRGARLPQLDYVATELYQVMFNCWQMDATERPSFQELINNLEYLATDCLVLLDLRSRPDFSYPQYAPQLESYK